MGGWSGGVYTRFRNWATDKANSVNPQATNFDQEDDGFAAGLNNCVTKDGLSKPTAPMDWNGQSLTGVLNFANTGTVSLVSGKLTMNLTGNITVLAPSAGAAALTLTGAAGIDALDLNSATQFTTIGFFNSGTQKASILYDNSATSMTIGGVAASVKLNFTTGAGTSRMTLAAVNADALQTVDDGGTFKTVGWRDAPQNTQNTNYTFALVDRGGSVQANGAVTVTYTIPANGVTPLPIGMMVLICNNSNNNLTVAINTDSLVLAGTATGGAGVSRTIASNGIGTLYHASSTLWFISGPGVS